MIEHRALVATATLLKCGFRNDRLCAL